MVKEISTVHLLPPEEAAHVLVGEEILVYPETVAWYVVPIRTDPILIRVTKVQSGEKAPHRHSSQFGDEITLQINGVVVDGDAHFIGREYEFWTVRGLTRLAIEVMPEYAYA